MDNFARNPRNDELESRFILNSVIISEQCVSSWKETCFKGESKSHAADSVPRGNLSKNKTTWRC